MMYAHDRIRRMMAIRKMIVLCSLSAGFAAAADLKVFVSGNDTGADVLRKAVSSRKVKCVKLADKLAEADAELLVKTQVIASPLVGVENSCAATLTASDGKLLWSDHSTSGLGLLAKRFSNYACGVNRSAK
jgi:hypothetical protein